MAGEKIGMFTADRAEEDDPSVAVADEEEAEWPAFGSITARHIRKP
jgi:hypothetical protein